ncbi:MAG: hypothetical protein KDA55_20095, partial [Planctomycetales bacterium]|nr:hypothetical protein [Planctomycetales bacterium]
GLWRIDPVTRGRRGALLREIERGLRKTLESQIVVRYIEGQSLPIPIAAAPELRPSSLSLKGFAAWLASPITVAW